MTTTPEGYHSEAEFVAWYRSEYGATTQAARAAWADLYADALAALAVEADDPSGPDDPGYAFVAGV